MARPYTCTSCGKVRATNARRGPLPRLCPLCQQIEAVPEAAPLSTMPPPRPPVAPVRIAPTAGPQPEPAEFGAPLAAEPPAPAPPYQPGFLETTLQQELQTMTSTNPAARTLSASALAIARAADMADPGDIKQVLAANKELRAVIDSLTKYQGGDDDQQSLFGAVQAEMVNPPAV